MTKSTKIILALFAAAVAYALFSSVVYPTWVEPLLTLKQRIAANQKTLDKLEEQDERFEHAKREYRRLAERVGAMDIDRVQNELRARLDALIIKHKLEGASVSPSRGASDKTGVARMTITINAAGTLESAVNFLQEVSELPHLLRIGNVALNPVSSGRRGEKVDRVSLRLPIEILVLPQQKMLNERLADADFKQPEKIVRHAGRDYSLIWRKTPFTDFVPLPTLAAIAGPPQTVPKGQAAMLQGSATGGDGKYTYIWDGPGLSAKDLPSVPADTSELGQKNYTLVVKDGSGKEASANVTITVVEPPPPPALAASAGQPQSVQLGQSFMLQGSATGGDGKYTYKWSGDGLKTSDQPSVAVDTSSLGPKTYALTVTDGSGGSSTAQVTVTVVEPPPQPRNTWPDRSFRQVAMTLQSQGVPGREGELLVVNQNTRERTFHKVGEDFDGGKLMHVDTRGGIVKWGDKYFIYPLGAKLDQEIPADSATNHPELLRTVERLKMADARVEPKADPEGAAPQPSTDSDSAVPPPPDAQPAPEAPSQQVGQVPADPAVVPPASAPVQNPEVLAEQPGPSGETSVPQPQPTSLPQNAAAEPPSMPAGENPPPAAPDMVPKPVVQPAAANAVVPAPRPQTELSQEKIDAIKERTRAKSRRPSRGKTTPRAAESKPSDG